MFPPVELQTTVLPRRRIVVETPQFAEGEEVTVVIRTTANPPRRRLSEVLAAYPGGQLFRSAEEVDAYLRAERDAWDS